MCSLIKNKMLFIISLLFKNLLRNIKDVDSLMGEGNGNPLQYSCLKNPTDSEASKAAVQRVIKSQTRLSD